MADDSTFADFLRRVRAGDEQAATEMLAELRRRLTPEELRVADLRRTHYLALLAESLGVGCHPEGGSAVVAEALAAVEATGERFYEAVLHRLRGELILRQSAGGSNPSSAATAPTRPAPDSSLWIEAEACFRQALDVARRQGAKSLELRSALSLARLPRECGQPDEAPRVLAETLGWFTEGWDTPDLQEARALFEEPS